MKFIGIDLEGVLIPEIWVALSNKTGISDLKLTTKDIGNYKELMEKRINLLKKNNIKAELLFQIASEIEPYDGAINFLSELRRNYQIVILSDTFFNLSKPVFEKLKFPTVFCHELIVNDKQMVSGMKLCIENHKKLTIKAMNKLNFKTIAIGDSLNDIGMLEEAKKGVLFRSSKEIINKYPHFDNYESYDELLEIIRTAFN